MKIKLFCFLLLATLPAYAEKNLDIEALQQAHQKCKNLLAGATFKKAKKCFDDLPDIPGIPKPKPKKPPQVEIHASPPTKTPLQKCRDLAKSDASDDEVMKCFKGLETKTECEKTSVTGKQVPEPPFTSWSEEWEKPLP